MFNQRTRSSTVKLTFDAYSCVKTKVFIGLYGKTKDTLNASIAIKPGSAHFLKKKKIFNSLLVSSR